MRSETGAVESLSKEYHVGVSGFSYPKWKGTFYPKNMKSEEFLAYYCQKLSSVEVNSSFYAAPKAAMIESWSEKTTESFVFSFKAPQLITHILKIGKGAAESAEKFAKSLGPLGPRQGPILFQLPPYSKADLTLLGDFLSGTSGIKNRVFEFRHESWLQESTYQLLESNGAGFCIAETEDLKPVLKVTGETAYFRLRMDYYDVKAVAAWARKIRDVIEDVKACYVYLRHDETGENALLAQGLAEQLKKDVKGQKNE